MSRANDCEDLNEMKKLVTESHSLKKSSLNKKKLVDELCQTINKVEKELSALRK